MKNNYEEVSGVYRKSKNKEVEESEEERAKREERQRVLDEWKEITKDWS